jgi:hypothetical protein
MSDDHSHLDAALPGFSRARGIVKANGDSIAALGFLGSKFAGIHFIRTDFERRLSLAEAKQCLS